MQLPENAGAHRGRGSFRGRFRGRGRVGRGRGTSSVYADVATVAVGAISSRKWLEITVNGVVRKWLVDTGSDICVVSKDYAKAMGLRWRKSHSLPITCNASGLPIKLLGETDITLEFSVRFVPAHVFVASHLADGAILGMSVFRQFQNVTFDFNGHQEPLVVSGISSSVGHTDLETVPEGLLRRAAFDKCHGSVGHPGVTRTLELLQRFYYWTGMKADVSQWIAGCPVCAEVKPRFFRPMPGKVITSKRPWERLSVDFVGPKIFSSVNRYFLIAIDEYSRFPFAWAVRSCDDQAAIDHLKSLFTLFGPPLEVHSDRGGAFISKNFINFLHKWGVRPSRTTSYHPEGNGQCERYNGVIWNTVQL